MVCYSVFVFRLFGTCRLVFVGVYSFALLCVVCRAMCCSLCVVCLRVRCCYCVLLLVVVIVVRGCLLFVFAGCHLPVVV